MGSLDEAAIRSDKEKRQRAAPIPGLRLDAGKRILKSYTNTAHMRYCPTPDKGITNQQAQGRSSILRSGQVVKEIRSASYLAGTCLFLVKKRVGLVLQSAR
jgi:hypothetical protein